jgi:hypothetical protein
MNTAEIFLMDLGFTVAVSFAVVVYIRPHRRPRRREVRRLAAIERRVRQAVRNRNAQRAFSGR